MKSVLATLMTLSLIGAAMFIGSLPAEARNSAPALAAALCILAALILSVIIGMKS